MDVHLAKTGTGGHTLFLLTSSSNKNFLSRTFASKNPFSNLVTRISYLRGKLTHNCAELLYEVI